MGINEKLLSIYRDRWTSLSENLKKLEPSKYANPFILSFDNAKYESADIRVMIFDPCRQIRRYKLGRF